MIGAISSPNSSLPTGTVKSATGLEAQLIRYQKELSDCVNCDTENTLAGRESIQSLSGKISAIKARIEEVNLSRSSAQAVPANSSPSTPVSENKAASPAGRHEQYGADTSYTTGINSVGSRLDIFA